VAVYCVEWTVGAPEHDANFDLVVGPWGEGADPRERVLVSLMFRAGEGGGLMVVDGEHRPANSPTVCGRALRRADVVGTRLAHEVFDLVDAIWLQDARIAELVARRAR
jgi:hypothetical protein